MGRIKGVHKRCQVCIDTFKINGFVKNQGKNIDIFEEFINSINIKDDLNETRNKIMDMIILTLSK